MAIDEHMGEASALSQPSARIGELSEQIILSGRQLARERSSDILIVNGGFDPQMEFTVLSKLRERRHAASKPANLILVLTTPGGVPEVAYRMGRSIQSTYATSEGLIGGWCKSAGTLLLIAMNSLALGDDAELGPLDMQLAKRDELDESDSGLVINEALENLEVFTFQFFDAFMRQIKHQSQGLVTLKTAADIASSVAKGVFEPIYRQIDPQKIGEIARSMSIGKAYGQRLNIAPKNLLPRALSNLLMGYPSHGFVIDRTEARDLFRHVRAPEPSEEQFLLELGDLAVSPRRAPVVELITAEVDSNEDSAKATSSKPARSASSAKPPVRRTRPSR